jgi:hypothetical protein
MPSREDQSGDYGPSPGPGRNLDRDRCELTLDCLDLIANVWQPSSIRPMVGKIVGEVRAISASVRHRAMNLLRSTEPGKSLKVRRNVAGWDPDHLHAILQGAACGEVVHAPGRRLGGHANRLGQPTWR